MLEFCMDQITDSKKLSIVYITPLFHPFKGGAEGNLYAMASRMAKEGHDVTVLTARFKYRNQSLLSEEIIDGIKIKRLWSIIQRPYYLCFTPSLLWTLLRMKVDMIHVSGFGFIWYEFCLLLKRLFARKTIFINTPHGPFMAATATEGGIRGFSKKIYTKFLSLFIPRLYNGVIAVLDKQKEWMVKDYHIKEEKIYVIPNGINYDYIEREIPVFSPEDKVIITYLNRMEWYKGVQDVLAAIINLKRARTVPEFEFWIMGRPGPYTETLKKIIADNELEPYTRMIFSPSDEERDRIFLEDSQINILPSKWEATGIALIEAMAKGNVIITTNQNEAVNLLIKPETGFSYNFGDIDALTEILKTILKDFALRQKMIAYNLEYARLFTWEAYFPKYLEMVEELGKGKGKG